MDYVRQVIDELDTKYGDYGDWSKTSVLGELLSILDYEHIEFDEYRAIDEIDILIDKYEKYGDWSKVSVLGEVRRAL
ncbi:hypothetical protein FP74_gp154 [Bacillus phage CAM003]|uniref:Uncharacterized protein n=4 Tax=Bastillevirus TaxID=1918010 RepID=A0A143FJR1_9CAUD|nr:hypothetical protein FP73_gp140 [Bacillus phage Hoody T]YP_009037108.1 hypothetical protein FP74_gp154 [Bacillus phage CAM003]AMW61961.1 hypothetical protein DNAM5_217 [Bacillus phage Vinny]ASU01059.1 hypothetical protein ANTHONY_219 [Bacillus phage Anthony]AHZ09642.1 hypothetical protein [Bacillus phage CAM003]AHZ10513.1 hypothetical protein [Bacillus phage Hoody T]